MLLRFLVSVVCILTYYRSTCACHFLSASCIDLVFILLIVLANNRISKGLTLTKIVFPIPVSFVGVDIELVHRFFFVTKFTIFLKLYIIGRIPLSRIFNYMISIKFIRGTVN